MKRQETMKNCVLRRMVMAFLMIVGCLVTNAKQTIIAPYGQFDNQAWEAKSFHAGWNDPGPADDWNTADFDDSEWEDVLGPLSRGEWYGYEEPLDFIATEWQDGYNYYWLRRHFTIDSLNNDDYQLYISHYRGAIVYLNGVLIYENENNVVGTMGTTQMMLGNAAKQALRNGDNVLAIYVESEFEQAQIDIGLYGLDYKDIINDDNVSVTFTNDEEHPWVAEDNTVFLSENGRYGLTSWFTLNFTLAEDAEMSFEWACNYYSSLDLYVDGINDSSCSADVNLIFETNKVFLKSGEHVVAFKGSIDTPSYYETGVLKIRNIQFNVIPPLSINVPVPGALSDSILAKVENIADVRSLKLSGELNDNDIYTLKNSLTNLYNLELEELDWTDISTEQFYGMTHLTYIALPANLETIGNRAFLGCRHLRAPKFPNTLTSIGSEAFSGTYAFTDIILPEGLSSLGSSAFSSSRLTAVTFPSTLKIIDVGTFRDCDYLTDVNFNGQTTINSDAFNSCDCLNSLTLPEGLQSIGNSAFYENQALKKIVLPSTLLTIGHYAFWHCNKLQEMTCSSVIPPSIDDGDMGVYNNNLDVYVPSFSVNDYKQAIVWNKFNIHGSDIMPENIKIYTDYNLDWPDSLSLDYRPNVGIDSNGSLTVNGNSIFSIKELEINWSENKSYEDTRSITQQMRDPYYCNRNVYGSIINNIPSRADDITVWLWSSINKWIFLSLPFDVKISDIQFVYDETPFVIRKYDGLKRAKGLNRETWVDMTPDSTLHAGQGYILRTATTDQKRDYNGFGFKALQTANKNNMFATQDLEVPLAYYESEFEHNRSWNLIGNPFPCFFDIRAMQTTAPITVWDGYYQNYEALSPLDDAYVLNPGQAFFVQRPVDEESITFLKEGRQTNTDIRDITYNNSARAKAPQAERSVFNIVLSNGEQQGERTRLVINAAASTDYEQGRDASKFMSLEQQSAQLYTLGSTNVRYAINERPLDNGVVNLGMQLPAEGLYTLTLNTVVENEVFLVDQLLGTEVRLDGNAEGYTFHAEAGTQDNRFLLRLGNGQATGITTPDVQRSTSNVQCYDLQGRHISQPQQKGIYVKDGHKTIMK